jgi:hypothetical protein
MTNYQINGEKSFNNWTRIHGDSCSYQNQLRLADLPFTYYANVLNTPQIRDSNPVQEFTVVGNLKPYNVRNEFERPVPTRLNPIYPTYTAPYGTSPFLGKAYVSREFIDDDTTLETGKAISNLKEKKSAKQLSEVQYQQPWNPAVQGETVQNAGQFNKGEKVKNMVAVQNALGATQYIPNIQNKNHVIFMNGAVPYYGISSRNELHNAVQLFGC